MIPQKNDQINGANNFNFKPSILDNIQSYGTINVPKSNALESINALQEMKRSFPDGFLIKGIENFAPSHNLIDEEMLQLNRAHFYKRKKGSN